MDRSVERKRAGFSEPSMREKPQPPRKDFWGKDDRPIVEVYDPTWAPRAAFKVAAKHGFKKEGNASNQDTGGG